MNVQKKFLVLLLFFSINLISSKILPSKKTSKTLMSKIEVINISNNTRLSQIIFIDQILIIDDYDLIKYSLFIVSSTFCSRERVRSKY